MLFLFFDFFKFSFKENYQSKLWIEIVTVTPQNPTGGGGGPRVNATVFFSSILSQIYKVKKQRFHTVVGLPKRLIYNVEHI